MNQSNMFWLMIAQLLTFHHLSYIPSTKANDVETHGLRAVKKDVYDEYSTKRELEWKVAGRTYKVVNDDRWYSDYESNEIRINPNADKEDSLYATDVCPGTDNQYTRENCPSPPNCTSVPNKWGKAKLCINRVPLPFDTNMFYVGAMKCIPWWENCDKCVCGAIDANSTCTYNISLIPDDDRQNIDCSNLESISYDGHEFEAFLPGEVPPTGSPTNKPTKSPTNIPTDPPTNKLTKPPTNTPTNTPTYKPTKAPTNKPTESLTELPTKSPTVSPTSPLSKSPTGIHSTIPSTSTSPSFSPTALPSSTPTFSPTMTKSFSPSETPSSSPSSPPSKSRTFLPSSSSSEIPSYTPSSIPSVSMLSTGNETLTESTKSLSTDSVDNSPVMSTFFAISGALAVAIVLGAMLFRKSKVPLDKPNYENDENSDLPSILVLDNINMT